MSLKTFAEKIFQDFNICNPTPLRVLLLYYTHDEKPDIGHWTFFSKSLLFLLFEKFLNTKITFNYNQAIYDNG